MVTTFNENKCSLNAPDKTNCQFILQWFEWHSCTTLSSSVTLIRQMFFSVFKAMTAKWYGKACLNTAARLQAWVVQQVDHIIHPINHYPVDSILCFLNTYPLDNGRVGADLSSG